MATADETVRFDIVSDVVCPWCIVGYRHLQGAVTELAGSVTVEVHWHPFELNPDMPAQGENLFDHVARKYGSSRDQSRAARARLVAMGADLGFTFRYTDAARIYNTFQAHQLLHWAATLGRQTDLKLALFEAYFTHGRDVGERAVLLDVVAGLGLDRAVAADVLADGRYAEAVRTAERFWTGRGIQGVPAFIVDRRYLVSGAQPRAVFVDVLRQVARERAA